MSTTKTVLYRLVGVDEASPAFDRAGRSATTFERTIHRVGKTVALVGAAMGTAAVAVVVESARAAVSFQASMEKIHTQAGASQKSVEALSKSVLKLGKYAEQSPQQLADSLFHLKSVGLNDAKAMHALKVASDLAAVSGARLEDTTNALAGAWRSGIKGAHSFGQTAATLNAIVGAGNMRMQDLVDAMSTGILPAARTFGVSLKGVGSALALLTDEGVPAQLAATRLRMTLSLMGAPSATAVKALGSIGLSSTALADKMRSPGGLVAAVALLKTHLHNSGLTATQAAQVIAHAFGGGRSSSAIQTMLNNLSTLERKQRQINQTTGNYGADVAAQRKTAQAQFALLKSSLDVLAVRIGLAVLPPLTAFVKFLGNTALPAVLQFTKTAGRWFGDIIPVRQIERDWHNLLRLLGVAPAPKKRPVNVGDLYNVQGARRSLFAGYTPTAPKVNWDTNLGGLGKAAAASTAGSLSTALANVNWGKLAGRIAGDLVTALARLDWARMGRTAAAAFVPFVVGFVNNIGSAILSYTWHHPLDMAMFLINLIPLGKLGGLITKLFGDLPIVGPLVKVIGKPLEIAGKGVEKVLNTVLDDVFGPLLRKIAPYFTDAAGWLLGKGGDIIAGLWHGLEDRFPALTRWLGKIGGWIVDRFGGAGKWLLNKGIDVLLGLLSGIESVWPKVGRFFYDLPGTVKGILRGARTWLLVIGADVIAGLYHGIKSAVMGVGHWIKVNVVDPVINAVKHWFGIRSPSTVMAGIGGHLITGLLQGLATHDGAAIARKIFGSLPVALEHLVEKGIVAISRLPGKALTALEHLGGSALKGLGKAGGWIWHLLTGGGGGGGGPAVAIGKKMAAALGWTGAQWSALYNLWMGESGWRWNALNRSSGAYGIPQSLPASKMAAAGADWRTNPATQIRWGLDYIFSAYGNPLNAYQRWLSRSPHWYGFGGRFPADTLIGVGDRGRELVAFDRPGRVYSPEDTRRIEGGLSVGQININHVPGYSTPADVKNAIGSVARQLRLARA